MPDEADQADQVGVAGLLAALPDALLVAESGGRVTLANRAAEVMFGMAALVGRSLAELGPERLRTDQAAAWQALVASAARRPEPARGTFVAVDRAGREFPVEVSMAPVQTRGGTRRILTLRDLTERQKADELRFRLAAIVDSSADAIIGKTLDGLITSWNDGARRVFGYAAEEVIGRPVTLLIPPERRHEEARILADLRRGLVTRFETVRVRKDGREIHVALTSSPTYDTTGRLIGASKVARDITERHRAELRLARAKEAAELASRELEAFSYSVAHDLRAPLRAIDGFAQMLLEDSAPQLDAEGRERLDVIRTSATRMGELIDALLALARLSRADLHVERVDLAALAREVVAELAHLEPGRAVEVVITGALEAELDRRLARVLITNLVGNAWKYTRTRTPGRIELGAIAIPGSCAFFVRDNGVGFPMAHAARLFHPFQRLHAARDFEGLGIGLATVQRIVTRHGGRVWAEAAADAGATFYVAFPSPASALASGGDADEPPDSAAVAEGAPA